MNIIYPPRPQGKIHPSELPRFEKAGKYSVQRKLNGERTLVHRSKEGEISLFSRHGRPHLRYKLPTFLKKELVALNFEADQEYWLDGELLHSKVANSIKDTIFLYDVLQAGKYLYGMKLADRLKLLNEICRSPITLADPPFGLKVSEHVWLAETWLGDFVKHFKEFLHLDLVEGLVVKDLTAGLDNFGSKPYTADWQWRCRKSGANYLM